MTRSAAETIAGAGGPPRFFALTALPSGTLLAGTCTRGVARSSDGGRTWASPATPPGRGIVYAFAAAGDGSVLAATSSGIYRSVDDGASWRADGLGGVTVYALLDAGGVLLAGTHGDGVQRSPDGGRTWQPAPDQPSGLTVYRLLAVPGDDVLAATDGAGVWRIPGGAPARSTATGLAGQTVYALAALPGARLLAGTRGEGLACSDNGGATWRQYGDGLPDPVVHTLVVDGGGTVYAGTGAGVARSTDGGATWGAVGDGVRRHRIFCIAVQPRAGVLAGSYDGMWSLAPAATAWTPVDTGLSGDAFSVSVDPDGVVFAGTATGVVCSRDAGATWVSAHEGLGAVMCHAVLRLSDGRWLAATDDGVFAAGPDLRWAPAGLSGERVRCLLEPEAGRVLAGTMGAGLFCLAGNGGWEPVDVGVPHPLAFDLLSTRTGTVILATGDVSGGRKSGTVLRSDDAGRTWRAAEIDPVTCYRVVESSVGVLLVGAQRCRILRSGDGVHWEVLERTGTTEAKLYALAIDGADRLFLGTSDGLLRSDDGGESWEPVGAGLEDVTVFDIAVHPAGPLVAATSAGMRRSTDGGSSWR